MKIFGYQIIKSRTKEELQAEKEFAEGFSRQMGKAFDFETKYISLARDYITMREEINKLTVSIKSMGQIIETSGKNCDLNTEAIKVVDKDLVELEKTVQIIMKATAKKQTEELVRIKKTKIV